MKNNEKLMSYLKATCRSMQLSYEWWVNEYKTGEGATYSAASSCIDSYLDDMHGAIGFAYFADMISEEQFDDMWKLSNKWASIYSDKISELFLSGRKEGE